MKLPKNITSKAAARIRILEGKLKYATDVVVSNATESKKIKAELEVARSELPAIKSALADQNKAIVDAFGEHSVLLSEINKVAVDFLPPSYKMNIPSMVRGMQFSLRDMASITTEAIHQVSLMPATVELEAAHRSIAAQMQITLCHGNNGARYFVSKEGLKHCPPAMVKKIAEDIAKKMMLVLNDGKK